MDIFSKRGGNIYFILVFCIWFLLPSQVFAIPSGISGYSGASGATCTACHSSGAAVPTVTLSADSGSSAVNPGSVTSYTLTMTGGPAVTAGLDVAATAGTLIDTNPSGTQILNGELTMTSELPVSGGTISWTFDWQAPNTAGTYTIYAAALSGNGGGTSNDGTGTTSLQITVSAPTNQAPTAVISSPATGLEGVSVTFDGSGSSDPDGNIVSYDWDFGDGSAGTGSSVSHSYAGGTYDVSLTVTDDAGNTDSATTSILIESPNVAPIAAIAGPANGTEGVSVTFDGSASSDPDGSIVSHEWDFGDNTAGSGESVSHVYAAGAYTVTLTVTDDMGATDSISLNIDIAGTGQAQPPIADAGGPYSADVGAAVQFDASGSTDPDGTVASYSWDFGDGSASGSGVGPVHVYTAAGDYTVVLTVTDNEGLTGISQTSAQISEVVPPQPDPQPDPTTGAMMYKNYCEACHGAVGGHHHLNVDGESAEDIVEAMDEYTEMQYLKNILSDSDIEAIADFMNGGSGDGDGDGHSGGDGDDDGHSGGDGDGDGHSGGDGDGDGHSGGDGDGDGHSGGDGDGDGHSGGDGDGDGHSGGDDDENDGNDRSSTGDAGPLEAQDASEGGGVLNGLLLLYAMVLLAIRRRVYKL